MHNSHAIVVHHSRDMRWVSCKTHMVEENDKNTHSAQQVHNIKTEWSGTYTLSPTLLSLGVVHCECKNHSPMVELTTLDPPHVFKTLHNSCKLLYKSHFPSFKIERIRVLGAILEFLLSFFFFFLIYFFIGNSWFVFI